MLPCATAMLSYVDIILCKACERRDINGLYPAHASLFYLQESDICRMKCLRGWRRPLPHPLCQAGKGAMSHPPCMPANLYIDSCRRPMPHQQCHDCDYIHLWLYLFVYIYIHIYIYIIDQPYINYSLFVCHARWMACMPLSIYWGGLCVPYSASNTPRFHFFVFFAL